MNRRTKRGNNLFKYRLLHYHTYGKSAVETATELYHKYNEALHCHKKIAKEMQDCKGGVGIANWKAYGLIRLGLMREEKGFVRKPSGNKRIKRKLKPEKLAEIRERRKQNG